MSKNMQAIASNYKHIDVRPDVPTTIALNSTSQSTFQLSSLYNTHESWVEMDYSIAALAATSRRFYTDAPPIQSLYVQTRDGTRLVQIDDFTSYWKAVCVPQMSDKRISANGLFVTAATLANTKGRCAFANWTNDLASTATAILAPTARRITPTGALVTPTAQSRHYKALSTLVASDLNADLFIKAKINLKDILNTILARNIDLATIDNLELQITWLPGVQWGFDSTAVATNTAVSEFTVAPVMSNLRLMLAVQQNPELIDRYYTQLKSGVNLVCDSVYAYRQNMGTSTTGSANLRVNPGMGSVLQRVIFAPIVTSQTLAKRSNMYNNNATLITHYDSIKYDNKELITNVLVGNGDSHELVKPHVNEYFQNLSDFDGLIGTMFILDMGKSKVGHPDMISGAPVDKESLIAVQVTKTAVDQTMLVYAILEKTISIGPLGVQVR